MSTRELTQKAGYHVDVLWSPRVLQRLAARTQTGSNSLSHTCRWICRYAANKSQRQEKSPSFLPSVISLLMTGNTFQLFSLLLCSIKTVLGEQIPVHESMKTSGPGIFDTSGETSLGFSVGEIHPLSFIQRATG